ncbi:leucine-rich repeat LGI family member 4 [Alligator mississippiensis]|uniref:leucine-rich repeat LGI family member 4 n=1 Tax=Alligator mississippiensis TaxID=8496 RepID=UPI002877CD53|nr:leucine-rich repeat LGI family member 4 [Alligator mississippiensis]
MGPGLAVVLALGVLGALGRPPPAPRRRCPAVCSCARDSARCAEGRGVPVGLGPELAALSLVHFEIPELGEGSFMEARGLQLLLLTRGVVGLIADDAFEGLLHLEYLFIEQNRVGALGRNALRGLRALVHLSLADNQLETLPPHLFRGLHSLTHVDLRGNPLRCDCGLLWLVRWLVATNASAEVGECHAPPARAHLPLRRLRSPDFDCLVPELVPFQALPFQALSVEPVRFRGETLVAVAQPFAGRCGLLHWDQLAGAFRTYATINATSPVACKPLVLGRRLVVVVAQLRGGSHVWKLEGAEPAEEEAAPEEEGAGPGAPPGARFVRLQALGGDLRRPHDVEAFRVGPAWFVAVADSSKAGASTVYRWDRSRGRGGGFYPHQALPAWHRDTDVEALELGGQPGLIVAAGARRPVVYRWAGTGAGAQLRRLTDIPAPEDVYAVRHFQPPGSPGQLYVCLSRYMGDAKVLRWEGSLFREVQAVPARGSLLFQPLVLGGRLYALLGSDVAYSRLYRFDPSAGQFVPGQELAPPAPRALAPVPVGPHHFVLISSFTGNSQIYRHVLVDLSA